MIKIHIGEPEKLSKNILEVRKMNRIDEIIYKETQKATYEEQCEQRFVHQEQLNEDYFEGLNDYLDGTMSI